jgi:hypothetical protein
METLVLEVVLDAAALKGPRTTLRHTEPAQTGTIDAHGPDSVGPMPPTKRRTRRQRLGDVLVDFVTSPKMLPALRQLLRSPAGWMLHFEELAREVLEPGDGRLMDVKGLWIGWMRFASPGSVGQGEVFITAYDAETWWTWHAIHNRGLTMGPVRPEPQSRPTRTRQHAS